MINHNFAPIRGRIMEKPRDKAESEKISVVVGRFVLPQQNYTHFDKYSPAPKYSKEHPLETFVRTIKENPKNEGKGTIIEPDILMLRAVTPYIFEQLYENWATGRRRKLTNTTQRCKKRNIHAIVSDINEVFQEQLQDDAELKRVSLSEIKHPRANMFEPNVEYYDDDNGDQDIDNAYFKRGPAQLRLTKRLSYSDDDMLSVGIRGIDDKDNCSVISDDLYRINSALRTVGLLSKDVRQLRPEDMEFDIPVFIQNKEGSKSECGPTFPIVPMGLVEFQPLSVQEIH